MKTTAKELRRRLGEYLHAVARGQEVEVTYRGRTVARLTSMPEGKDSEEEEDPLFGLWADRQDLDVDGLIDSLREGRC